MSRSYDRAAAEGRPVECIPDFVPPATGSALISVGRTQRDLHRERRDRRAALDVGQRPRLGHRRVRDAAGLDRAAQGARHHARPRRRPHRRDPAPDRPGAARRRRLRGARRAHRLPGLRRARRRRRHALRVDHRRLRRVRAGDGAARRPTARSSARRCAAASRRSPAGSSTASPLLDLDYSEDSRAEVDANVVMTGDGGLVEVQATAERTPLSRAHLDELLGAGGRRDRSSCARSRPPRSPRSGAAAA